MFAWLGRLLSRRPNRRIFRFHDGNRWRALDPLVAMRSLMTDRDFNWETHPPLVDQGDLEAMRITATAVQRAFGVKPYSENGEGLTEGESIALLLRFAEFSESLKKSTDNSPTSSAPTDSPDNGSTPNQSSDLHSTSTEPSAASQPAY